MSTTKFRQTQKGDVPQGISTPASVSAVPTFGVDVRAPFSDRATVFVVRLISLLGLLLANYYSWTMTVTGFVNTQFLPDNSVLPNTYIPHVVAGFVQLGILACYLSVPYCHRRRVFVISVAACFAISLIVLSALFALFSITLTSQSGTIVSHQIELIRGMNKKIVDLDDLCSTTFIHYLDELDVLSQRACDGKDRTQVAQCGSISKGYLENANDTRAKYGSQLEARGSYTMLETSDIMGALTSLRSNYMKLSQKVEGYKKFAKEHNLSSDAVAWSFEALGSEVTSFGASLNRRNPDAKTLVLTRVLDDLGEVFSRRAEPLFYFALTIAFLPDMLSITFTLILLIARAANQEAVTLRQAVHKAHEQAEWYDKYAIATEKLHRAKQRWRDRRRVANVAEAVDQSVPDTA